MNKRRFTEEQNEISRKSNKKKALENRIARFDNAMLYLRIENDKIGRIGKSIVFDSDANERFCSEI